MDSMSECIQFQKLMGEIVMQSVANKLLDLVYITITVTYSRERKRAGYNHENANSFSTSNRPNARQAYKNVKFFFRLPKGKLSYKIYDRK